MKGGGRNGKRATSTVTEDQHGMTASCTSATETREVSQPLRTPGKNSVLSEPTSTLQSRQLDGPLRRKSNRNTTQLAQSKQLSGPEMSNNCHSNPDRKYYKPTNGAKTYYIKSPKVIYRAGKTLQRSSSLTKKANYQTAKKPQFITNQVQLSLMVQKSF